MLVATITAILLVFGLGGGINFDILDILDAAEDVVEDRVEDGEHRERLLTTLKRMELETHEFTRDIRTHREALLALDLDPGATREQYIDVFRRLDARWVAAEESLLDRAFELRAGFRDEEWTAVHRAIREELDD
jgi:hypothetical protein